MPVLFILKRLKNMVEFRAEGIGLEQILNYAAQNGFTVYEPVIKDYVFFGKVAAKDYKKFRSFLRKKGIKIKIVKKTGFYFFIRKNKRTVSFFASLLFVVLITALMNNFIWDIRIDAPSSFESKDILTKAANCGLKIGVNKKSVDEKEIEWSIMLNNSNVAWVGVNYQGSVATIKISEKKPDAIMKYDDDIPINIIASKYGVIRKINVYDGQKMVKVGDAVMKGDLLVGASFQDRHGRTTLKHSRADVIAETDYQLEVSYPFETVIESKGKKLGSVTEINVLGKKITLGNSSKYSEAIKEEKEQELYFFGIKLPVSVITTSYFDVKRNSLTYTAEQAKDGAFALLAEKEKEQMKDFEIVLKEITEKYDDENYYVSADYVVLMDICEEQEILTEGQWENSDYIS